MRATRAVTEMTNDKAKWVAAAFGLLLVVQAAFVLYGMNDRSRLAAWLSLAALAVIALLFLGLYALVRKRAWAPVALLVFALPAAVFYESGFP